MHAGHPGVRAPPPAEDEEEDAEADEPFRDLRRLDVARDPARLDAEGVEEEAPEHGDRDGQDDAQGEAVQGVVLPVELPAPRVQDVHEEEAGQDEDEDQGGDHAQEPEDAEQCVDDGVGHGTSRASGVYLKVAR